ncbi:hypothetical protein RI534_13210 [Aeromonas allosaccharophila]|uniref:hypothetical protein n=1 Tax=Aeromonas allosaccharophila TaxID=656 RepID=UPI00342254D1
MEEEEVRRSAETGKNKAQQVRTEGPWSKWKPMIYQALGFLFMALPICITNWCDAILKVIDTYRAIFGH